MFRTTIRGNKLKFIGPTVLTSMLVLSGCSGMKDAIEREGGELAPESDSIIESTKNSISKKSEKEDEVDPNLSNYELDETQKELLEESETQTAEDAIAYEKTNLSELSTLDTSNVPTEKEDFKDAEEAAKFFAYQFFRLDAKLISATEFFRLMKPHFNEAFLEQFPKKDEDRIATFEAYQNTFTEFLLGKKMVSYKISELEYSHLKFDAGFHRVYNLDNGEKIYYLTSITRDSEDNWKIVDNGTSAGFIENQQ